MMMIILFLNTFFHLGISLPENEFKILHFFCFGLWVFVFSHGSGLGLNKGVCSVKFDPTRVTQLSWNPRFDPFPLLDKWVDFILFCC